MTFSADISKFVKKSNGNTEIVVRRIGLELFNKVVMKSPVDTGRFRGNWYLSVNAPYKQTFQRFDMNALGSSPGDNFYNEAQSNVNRWKLADNSIYITNNLPYAERLEFGYSDQAPQGMARLSVMEIASKYA